jgi:hypothetical protein
MLLRWAGAEVVDDVDWDCIRLKVGQERYRTIYRKLDMTNPLALTRAESEQFFETATTLEELLDGLGASQGNGRGEPKKGAKVSGQSQVGKRDLSLRPATETKAAGSSSSSQPVNLLELSES